MTLEAPSATTTTSNGVPRRHGPRFMTIVSLIAAAIAVATAIGAGFYYYNRPVTLRVAVGPANSDDFRMVQSIARVFDPQAAGRDRSSIKLRLVPTEGSVQSAVAMDAGQADLAVIRGDLKLPKEALAVATLRKNVVAIWVPTPPEPKETKGAKGKKAAAKAAKDAKDAKIEKIQDLAGHKIGVIGRSQSNVNLLRLILQQYGVPAEKVDVVQFAPAEVNEAIRSNKAEAFMAVGPVNSQITTDAITATVREGGTPTFLPIWPTRSKAGTRSTTPPRSRPVRSAAPRRGRTRASRRSASARTSSPASRCRTRRSPPSRASCSRCASS
jgi:ABC-type nitrate/sulfonate/bicarbonate transport system substrate-binding protein